MIRIGVIGAGNHSTSNHGPALKAYKQEHPEEIELAAVCDLDAGRAKQYAEQFGFARTFTDYDAMLEKAGLDGLVAVTPIDLTRPIVGDLLSKKLPLLLEKPPGENIAQTRELLELAQEHHCPHMISCNRRFSEPVSAARNWLAEHAHRPAVFMHARMLRYGRHEPRFIVGTGFHLVDTVLSFMGIPSQVRAARSGSERPGCYHATLNFDQDRVAILEIHPSVGTNLETYTIYGHDYCVQIDHFGARTQVYDRGESAMDLSSPNLESALVRGAFGETEAFVRAIRDGKNFHPTLSDGLESMTVAEAILAGGEMRP